MNRVDRVRDRLAGVDAEALLISDLTNIRWLTGFTGSNGWVVLGPDQLTLVTDGRYGEQAANEMAAAGIAGEVLVGTTGAATQAHLATATKQFRTTGFEATHVSYQQHASWSEAFATVLMPTSGLVEGERRTKDDAEIAAMATACRIADAALAEVAPMLSGGLTEAQVRNHLEIRMRELGASGPSYDTIVATGPINAALPHHRPTDTLIEQGHTVIIDVGALVDGYHSDMTRSFVMGTPTALQQELYELVLVAQMAGVAAVAPGLTTKELDAVCRDIITGAGYGDWFTHGTGHGVGLLIHEDPFVNRAGQAILQVGDVVTVEPGVYREGFGGIRVEDLVVVTSEGCRVLTSAPKESPCPPSPPTT
ncbi:MAG TPA: aminopeptidase P family protein [Ilumatobacteraceae bacterium]|nr:aminopeptidase P family protein [Ilumatobacteraceae bacterium]